MKRLLTVLLFVTGLAFGQTDRGIKVFQVQQGGTAVYTRGGGLAMLNCSTGVTCTASGTGVTITAAASPFASGGVTANVIPKSNGASLLADSSITDDGTSISSAEPIRLGNGSAAAPSFAFTGSTSTGFWSDTTFNHLTSTVAGVNVFTLVSNQQRWQTGALVGFVAAADTDGQAIDTGFSRASANVVAVGNAAADSSGKVNLASVLYRGLAQTYFVTSNFTTSGVGTALETITGLTFTFPASTAMNVRVDCNLLYSQAVGTAAVAFGFKDTTVAPTNLAASGIQYTSATASTEGTLAASSTTTATAITSATPSVVTTIWHAQLHLLIEQPSNASSSLFAIQASTATAADLVTVYRGSYCTLAQ